LKKLKRLKRMGNPARQSCWWNTNDCCGLVCANMTLGLLVFAFFVQIKYCIGPWFGGLSGHTVFYTFITILAMVAHTKCQFMNPGAIDKSKRPPETDKCQLVKNVDGKSAHRARVSMTCDHCKSIKPSGAHHCSMCQRCVIKMDHHCPWVNNCVAMFNQKLFVLFVFYTALCCIWCFISLICQFVICSNWQRGFRPPPPMCHDRDPLAVVFLIMNFIESIIFGLFTIIMLFDQICAISENTPYIDKLKGKKGIQKGFMQAFTDVFGEDFGPWWLVPYGPTKRILRIHNEMVDSVLGLYTPQPPGTQGEQDGQDQDNQQQRQSPASKKEK